MNTFFLFNFGFTLTVFIPYFRLRISPDLWVDSIFKILVVLSIFAFVFVRGRFAMEVKRGYLYCNSYPFFRKFELCNILKVSIENRKVHIVFKGGNERVVTYFFGIKGAIKDKVAQSIQNYKV